MSVCRLVGLCLVVLLVVLTNDRACLGLTVSSFRPKKRGVAKSPSSATTENGNIGDAVVRKQNKEQQAGVLLLHSICSVTGKDEYKFGDLARWLDQKARDKVQELANKNRPDSSESSNRFVSTMDNNWSRFRHRFKVPRINNLLQQTKIVLLVWVVRIVMLLQWETYVLQYLPDVVLVEIVHLCLNKGARPKILRVVATEMDHRIQSLMENYHFGDVTRSTIHNVQLSQQAWRKLTTTAGQHSHKQQYVFGNISKQILQEALQRQQQRQTITTSATTNNSNSARQASFMTQAALIQKQIDFINEMQTLNQTTKQKANSKNRINNSKGPNSRRHQKK